MGSLWSTESPNNQENEVENQTVLVSPQRRIMEHSLQPNRLRNPQVTILNEILKEKVKLDDALEKENNEILQDFLNTFIPEMKRHDKTFALLYQRIYYTGSYFAGLRVSKPDEYDLNVLLKLPFRTNTVSIQYQSQVPSYVKYQVTDETNISRENGLAKLFESGFLIQDKVRVWFQSVIDKAMKTYKPPRNVVQVNCSAAGPARTILLVKRSGRIDVDLVPAIECSLGLKPPGIDGRVYAKVKDHLQCFLVPKPYQPSRQSPVSETERSRLWRAHYPQAESLLIHDVGCVKPVIKLLKLLRDKENWKIIASYYLKTIVMWMVLEDSNKDNWKMDQIGKKFMEALQILQSCVERKQIRYFFSSRYNLLEKLTDAHASNIQNRLRGIIKDIERDDQKLWEIFGCRPTFSMTR